MMTYEAYMKQMRDIEQKIHETRVEQGRATELAIEECNQEHRRLKMELHEGIQKANMQRDEQIREIHGRYVAERNDLFLQREGLIAKWRSENGITAKPAGEQLNGKGGEQ